MDARTPSGRLARGIHFEFAAYHPDLVGARWSEAFQNRLRRGLPPLGGDYFGYVRRGRQPHPLFHDRTILNPEDGPERYGPDAEGGTGEILAGLYRRWLADRSFYALAKDLNMRMVRTPGGREWRQDEIAWMLDQGFGAGKISVHDPACECGRATRCNRRALFPGAHRAVIDGETWKAYTAARQTMKRLPRKSRTSLHSLSGLIVCGMCGRSWRTGGCCGRNCGGRRGRSIGSPGPKNTRRPESGIPDPGAGDGASRHGLQDCR
ncbi:recombinase family protein [Planomonospora algeriensis]